METQNQGCIKQTLIIKELLKMSESHISSHIKRYNSKENSIG